MRQGRLRLDRRNQARGLTRERLEPQITQIAQIEERKTNSSSLETFLGGLLLLILVAVGAAPCLGFAFFSKTRGRMSFAGMTVFGATVAGLLGATWSHSSPSGDSELIDDGNVLVQSGAIPVQGHWSALLNACAAGFVGGLVGVMTGSGFRLLSTGTGHAR